MQLPLPKHLSSELVIAAISPEKDVDGFHVVSAGSLLTGRTGFRPCTPYGVMKLLEEAGCDPAGKHAVVIGRSNIVGKPAALLLLAKNATVTICHSKTKIWPSTPAAPTFSSPPSAAPRWSRPTW